MIRTILFIITMLMLLQLGCRDKVVEPFISNFQLAADDVRVTELNVHLQTDIPKGIGKVILKRNGRAIFGPDVATIYTSNPAHGIAIDTMIHDQYLLPKHTYSYKAYYLYEGTPVDSSSALFVTTQDTTSHAWTWEKFTIGGIGSGFYDVAIITDTLVYAVGEISIKDSLGNWINPPYNFAKFRGRQWELSTTSDSGYGYGQIRSIYAFNSNDVWVGSSIPEHWDGQRWIFYGSTRGYQGGFWINKIWGTSSHNLYVAGDGGNIRYYDGTNWQKLESGTTLDIQDIYGANNEKTGEMEIMAVASLPYRVNRDRKILKISGTTVTTLSDSGIHSALTGVWFVPGKKYYVMGDGSFSTTNPWDNAVWTSDPGRFDPLYYNTSVRGNGLNDMVIVCDFGLILHYNGYYWKEYGSVTNLEYGYYYKVAMQGNLIVAVGDNYNRGIIIIGRRS